MNDTETSLKARIRRALGRAEEWLMPARLNCVICKDPRRADPETGICITPIPGFFDGAAENVAGGKDGTP